MTAIREPATSIETCLFVLVAAVLVAGMLEIGLYIAEMWTLRRNQRHQKG